MLKVIKRINNNVVLVRKQNTNMIVTGKGIGYKVYPDDTINEKFVEQRYIMHPGDDVSQYIDLLKEIPMEILDVSKQIVEMAERELNFKFSVSMVFTLADHFCFAIERYKKGIAIDHPLNWEIKQFYPKEMEIGNKALSILGNMTNITIPEGEAVFIAMHLINASGGLSGEYNVEDLTKTMIEIVQLLESVLNINIDQNTTVFSRFITHLRFYLIRQLKLEIDDSINDELLEIVKEKYPKAYESTQLITNYLKEKYGTESLDSERLYLTLHINRLLR